ncbi:PQQ-binding-like beta-propeller repeat protein [Actinomadura fulvescens]|uniref:outer membrane protein assembly factor BamB family protein n=1 Tax=Actinomadura fulvescens TaxID=46160 RepID=UPI0031D8F9BB
MLLRLDGRGVGVGDGAGPLGWAKPKVWATDAVVAVAGRDAVTGYSKDGGAKRWSVPLADVCGFSAHHVDGRVAVMLGATPRCGRTAVIDLRTGVKVWERTLALGKDVSYVQALIGGGAVVANWAGGAMAFSVRDGRRLWSTPQRSRDCFFSGFGGGDMLLANRICRTASGERATVQRLDPRTGRALWSHQLQGEVMAFAAAPVIGVGARGRIAHLAVLDAKSGTERARIPLPTSQEVKCDPSDRMLCKGIVVGGGSLYTKPGKAGDAGNAPIVAFDLATGRRKWEIPHSRDGLLTPVGFEGGRLLAVRSGTKRRSAGLVEVAADSGRIVARHDIKGPRHQINDVLRQSSYVRYAAGRLLVFDDLVTKPGEVAVLIV